jgi:hypothetical protein
MCGYESDGINFEYHAVVLRIDSLGNELWRKFPINSIYSQCLNTIRKFQGNYVTVGGSDTARVMKLNLNGDVTYQKLIPSPRGVSWGNISYIYGEVYQNDKIIFYRNQGNLNNITFSVIMKLDSNFNTLTSLRLESNTSATFIKSVLPLTNNDLIFVGDYNSNDITN